MRSFRQIRAAMALAAALAASSAWAETFYGVQPASLDQPRVNAFLRLPGGDPLTYDGIYNVQAFFDTGASGMLLSQNTASLLGVPLLTWTDGNGQVQPVIFSDVGVAGTDDFHVSGFLEIGLAPYHHYVSYAPPDGVDPIQYYSVFPEPVRAHIGPLGAAGGNPLLENLDVFGTPLMRGKVVVMDPKPVDTFMDTMRTYVYDRNTGQSGAPLDLGPGIPATSRTVKLSKANFEGFTTVDPPGPEFMPTIADNPFIGPNPLVPDDTSAPPTILTHNGIDVPASLLLDTGAAASLISTAIAEQWGIRYKPGLPPDSPELEGVPLSSQFSLTVGGIGGTKKMLGFFMDGLTLPTEQAAAQNDPDLNIHFVGAPVLVGDITLMNPTTGQPFTLDGLLGMNFLVASVFLSEGADGETPIFGELMPGNFEWITYDHDAGIMGLEPKQYTSIPGEVFWKGSMWEWVFTQQPSVWDIGGIANFGSGNETLTYADGDQVTFSDGSVPDVFIESPVAPGSVLLANDFWEFTFTGAAIRGYTGVRKTGEGPVRFRNSNTFTGLFDIRAGLVRLQAWQDIGPVAIRDAELRIEANARFKELTVGSGGIVSLFGDRLTLIVDDLVMIGNAEMDLTNGVMIVEAQPSKVADISARLQQYIIQARDDGAWGGAGLTSTSLSMTTGMTLAVLPLSQVDPTVLANLVDPATLALVDRVHAMPLLITMGLLGDLDLNGTLNGDDFYWLDRGFMAGAITYGGGDLNYDGVVDANDFHLMDLMYLRQQAGGGIAAASPVPEPATALLAALAAPLLLLRRRYGKI